MRAVFDMDVLLFRCCFATEHRNYLAEQDGKVVEFTNKKDYNAYVAKQPNPEEITVWTEHTVEPLEYALANIRNTVDSIIDKLQVRSGAFYLSGKDNFRYKIATVRPYKGNRDPSHRPVHLQAARDYATKNLGAIIVNGKEADDALGIDAMKAPEHTIIVTNDKDLKQIPCWHYNWTKEEKPNYVPLRDAVIFFYQQVLSGDPTDNIPGIEGLGPEGAKRLLAGVTGIREAEQRVLAAYESKYGIGEGSRRFLETGRLVKIHTSEAEVNNLWYPKYVELKI